MQIHFPVFTFTFNSIPVITVTFLIILPIPNASEPLKSLIGKVHIVVKLQNRPGLFKLMSKYIRITS